MANEINYELWQQFNLARGNPSPGGGIFYCMKYSKERLEAHQAQIISVLTGSGATIRESRGGLGVAFKKMDDDGKTRAVRLLEELSVLNEALEYHSVGIGECRNIEDLKNHLISRYFESLARDKVSAYNLVDVVIPQIVKDVSISDLQGLGLKAHEKRTLAELKQFASRQVEIHNKPQGFVVIG
jgi:hypothetical protein